jgi:type I restriction enzyme S subunit
MSWDEIEIQEVSTKIVSGGTPKSTVKEYYNGNIPWLRTQEVIFKKIYNTDIKITEKGLNNSSAKMIEANCVIIAMYGNSAGRVGLNKIPLSTNQACCNVQIDKTKANEVFVFYNLLSRYHELKSLSRGAAQSNLNSEDVKKFVIPYPPLETQKRIADILSAYDDLIENNLKRIKLLEQAAQNIYKEWFVHLRFPGHENTPINEETGLPEGWVNDNLDNLLKLVHGFAFKAKDFVNEPTDIMVIRMGNFNEFGNLQLDKNVRYLPSGTDFKDRYKLHAGNLLMVLSDVTRDGRIIGNVGILPEKGITYALNQRVAKLELNKPHFKNYFLSALNSYDFKEYCKSRANGATVLNLKTKDVLDYEIIIPSYEMIESFLTKIDPINLLRENLTGQNEKLKAARDILLPRLMNRTIEVN